MEQHEHEPAGELVWTPVEQEVVPELVWTPHESAPEAEPPPAAGLGPLSELPAGSPIEIPSGFVGVMVLPDGQGWTLEPGRHGVLEAQARCLLLPTRWEWLRFSSPALVSDNRRHGMLSAVLDISVGLRAVDPPRFATRTIRQGALRGRDVVKQGLHRSFGEGDEAVSFAQTHLSDVAADLLCGGIAERLAVVARHRALGPEALGSERQALAEGAQGAVARLGQDLGLEVCDLQLHDVRQLHRAPCRRCGSVTAPTGFACFRRSMSLVVLLFTREEHGHYCVRCALAQGLLDTAISAAIGWFGVVGLFLTPCYIVANLGNLAALLVSRKAPTLEDEATI